MNSNNKNLQDKTPTFGIQARLILGFGLLSIILIFAIALVLVKVTQTEHIARKVIDIDMVTYDKTFALQSRIYQIRSAMDKFLLTQDTKYKMEFYKAWEHVRQLKETLDQISPQIQNQLLQQKWQQVTPLLQPLEVAEKNIMDYISLEANNNDELVKLEKNALPLTNQILAILDGEVLADGELQAGLTDIQFDHLHTGTENIIHNISLIRTIEYVLLLSSVLLSSFIAWFTARQILTPLKSAINIAQSVAAGERDVPIQIKSHDETGQLLMALSSMQDAIKKNEEHIKENEKHARQLFENIVSTAQYFGQHSSQVAGGDLRQRLDVSNDDVMAPLGRDLNKMTEGLSQMTQRISEASHHMITTIQEVRQAVDAQSTGATEQASSINQITASLEEIEKSTMQTMEKAKALGSAAAETREKGQQGLNAVEESVNGMKAVREKVQLIAQTILDLSHQTQQVGEITAVVNNLAQQSKMLALNASIEAAKAGEAGKGFAVVAVEVKNLAEQSEQSTRQVQKILEDIRLATEKAVMVTEEGTKGVDHGTFLVENTGETVRALTNVIEETTIASQQIEAAVRQESIGIEQITAGMNEINSVTASFVESVKQTTEAIENLAQISTSLKEYLDIYKT